MGDDRYLFSVHRLNYLLRQSDTSSLGPAVETITQLSQDLAQRGIRLLVVPIPSNAEIYPDKIAGEAPDRAVSPLRAEFMLRLLEDEVDVLDLLPAFEEKKRSGDETLYRRNDPHWNTPAIRMAAAKIAERLRAGGLGGNDMFTIRSRTILKANGTLLKELTEEDRSQYHSPDIDIDQVFDEYGQLFRPAEDSSIVVLGDSYVAMYSDHGAGISAHVSAMLVMAAGEFFSAGGGPGTAQMLARRPKAYFKKGQVFVLCFVATYLDSERARNWRAVPLR